MDLYLDDDIADGLLVKLLRAAGHAVLIPTLAGTAGAKDPKHFIEAIKRGHILLTGNHKDFELLDELVRLVGGKHPGILVVRKDNDPKRDMTQKQIVRAIRNFAALGTAALNSLHILNHYR